MSRSQLDRPTAMLAALAEAIGVAGTVRQAQTLLAVSRLAVAEGITQADIERHMEIPQSSANRALLALRAAGLVEQRDDPSDGRRRLVVLTHKGQRLVAGILTAAKS